MHGSTLTLKFQRFIMNHPNYVLCPSTAQSDERSFADLLQDYLHDLEELRLSDPDLYRKYLAQLHDLLTDPKNHQ